MIYPLALHMRSLGGLIGSHLRGSSWRYLNVEGLSLLLLAALWWEAGVVGISVMS